MGHCARQCYAWKVGLEKFIKEYNHFGKKQKKNSMLQTGVIPSCVCKRRNL